MIKASIRQYETMMLDPQFDSDMKFKLVELDPVTSKPILRLVEITGPSKDVSSILLSSKAGADDRILVTRLTDLLEKCLLLDPIKRLKVVEALKHPLFHSNMVPIAVTNTTSNGNK
jgi:serine/threonine-protein kinase PRP4